MDKIVPLLSLPLILVTVLADSPNRNPFLDLSREKRQIGGSPACMHIYTVPRHLTQCDPTDETRDELQGMREALSAQRGNLDELVARLDAIDPDRPKELPDDVKARLATVDQVHHTQAGHTESLRRLDSDISGLKATLSNIQNSERDEMVQLIKMQTDLVQTTLKNVNASTHEEYVKKLSESTHQLSERLSSLQGDMLQEIRNTENNLQTELRNTEEVSRTALEQVQGRVDVGLQDIKEQLKQEVSERLQALEAIGLNTKGLDRMESQLTTLRERQVSYEVTEEELKAVITDLRAQLETEKIDKEALRGRAQDLQDNLRIVREDMAGLRTLISEHENGTVSLREELKALRAEVDRRNYIVPRMLKIVDCQDAQKYFHSVSGVYNINPFPHTQPFEVYCEVDGDEGWTVIQRRQDGSVDFFLDWVAYKEGFGDVQGEYWLGLQKIHGLTNKQRYKLRVDMQDWNGKWWHAEYSRFWLDSEADNYRLHVSGYSGDAGDSLSYHDGMPFSTSDNNNDQNDGICAAWCHGAWWYKDCFQSNLNGRYYPQGPYVTKTSWGDGVVWRHIQGTNYYSLKSVVMKIRAYQ